MRRLAQEVRTASELPDVRARLIAILGTEPVARGPEEFAAIYKKDLPLWEQLVKQSGATLD